MTTHSYTLDQLLTELSQRGYELVSEDGAYWPISRWAARLTDTDYARHTFTIDTTDDADAVQVTTHVALRDGRQVPDRQTRMVTHAPEWHVRLPEARPDHPRRGRPDEPGGRRAVHRLDVGVGGSMSAAPAPGSRGWRMVIRLAGQLIADGGRTHIDDVRDLAEDAEYPGISRRPDGQSRGRASTHHTKSAVRALAALGLAEQQRGQAVIAGDLAALAAWVAAQLAAQPWTE